MKLSQQYLCSSSFSNAAAPTAISAAAVHYSHPLPTQSTHVLLRAHRGRSYQPGAFYLRLVGKPLEVYQYLEPLYNDYRKIRERKEDGAFGLTHMDEVCSPAQP